MLRVYRGAFIAALPTIILLVGCDSGPRDNGVAAADVQLESVLDLGIIDQGSMLLGRDGGYSGIVDNDIRWVFGDSVFAEASGNTWLSNSSAIGNPLNTNNQVLSIRTATDENSRPTTVLDYTAEEHQYNQDHLGSDCTVPPCGDRYALWPGPLVRDESGNRTLVFYGKIHASPGEFNFSGIGQSIAIWRDGEDRPERPVIDADAEWPTLLFGSNEPAIGAGAILWQEHLHAFACQINELVKPCVLSRVPIDSVQQREQWEFWSGTHWQSDYRKAMALFHGNDIMSVHYDESLERFIAVYSKPLSREIQLRTSNSLTGPWSQAVHVATARPTSNGNGWVYDALAHPEFASTPSGKLYITYTRDTGSVRELRLLEAQLRSVIAPNSNESPQP